MLELEGHTLPERVLGVPGLLTVTSLRHPIDRIVSLYWYEHVAWHVEVKRQPQNAKPFVEWVANWVDSSPYKQAFLRTNPGTNYVEVENYYTKGLVGWGIDRESNPVTGATKTDLADAKSALGRFDLVFITEWSRRESQLAAFDAALPGSRRALERQLVQGSEGLKRDWAAKLMPDGPALEGAMHRLRVLNALDLELWGYAQEQAARRHAMVAALRGASADGEGVATKSSGGGGSCARGATEAAVLTGQGQLRKQLGLFRPPGHKE